MPMPSVTLWSVKPRTRKVPSAAAPVANAEPIARPSPKLWIADAERDRGRERHPLRAAALAAPDGQQQQGGERGDQPDQGPAVEARRRLARELERLLERVDEEEQEQADGKREREVVHVAAPGLERRVEEHPERHRQDADEQADEAERAQAVGPASPRHVDRVLEGDAGLGSITTWCASPSTHG